MHWVGTEKANEIRNYRDRRERACGGGVGGGSGLGRLTKFFHTTPVPNLATKIAAFYAGTGPQKIFIPRPDYITITVPATPQHPSSVCVVATHGL